MLFADDADNVCIRFDEYFSDGNAHCHDDFRDKSAIKD
jgi:hypothetical protein